MAKKVRELKNGVVVYQVTDDPVMKDAIYCERCYCSPDSSCFVFRREIDEKGLQPWSFTAEYVACDFGTWETRVVGQGHSYPDISRSGNLFHTRWAGDGSVELVRIDLTTGQSQAIPVAGGVRPLTGMTVTPDEKYLAYGFVETYEPQVFGVECVDLAAGTKEVLCYDPYVSNPHTQIDPSDGKHVMVQQNRGSKFDAAGKGIITSTHSPGTTHFLVGIHDKKITQLPVGPPHTATVTGHSQWIGETGEIMLTIAYDYDDGRNRGTLLGIRPGQKPRIICPGATFNHLHVSLCGRFFCADDVRTNDVFVGSVRTGKTAWVCNLENDYKEAHAKYSEAAHSHAYLSRDLKWMVYNSCRTGRPEVHVASIPPDLLDGVA